MPMGNEIHYAVAGVDNIRALMLSLGVKFLDHDDNVIDAATLDSVNDICDFHDDEALQEVNRRLEAAYFAAAARMGWTYLGQTGRRGEDHTFDTPYGQRRVSPFALEFRYDPDEAGDEESMASLGVALSGRYVPTFLDMESAHGTLYNIDFMDVLEKSRVAIEEIVREVPELANMRLLLREIFY